MPESVSNFAQLSAAVVIAFLVSVLRALGKPHRSWRVTAVAVVAGGLAGAISAYIAEGFGAGPGILGLVAGVFVIGGKDTIVGLADEFEEFREDRAAFVEKWLRIWRGSQ